MKSIDAKSRYFCWKLLVSLWAPTYTSFVLHSHTRGLFYYPFYFALSFAFTVTFFFSVSSSNPCASPATRKVAWLIDLRVSLIPVCLFVRYVVTSLRDARLWYCRGSNE